MKVLKYVGLALLTVVLLCAAAFFLDVVINKNFSLSYDDMDDADRVMFEQLSAALVDGELDEQLILARSKGFVFRGATYCFNVDFYQKDFIFGWTQAIFATEILLPAEMNLPSVYRLATFTPGTFDLFFEGSGTLDLAGDEVVFLKYTEEDIEQGSFANEIPLIAATEG